MKKILLLFALCLLIKQSGVCQSIFPQLRIENKDSLIVITLAQGVQVNVAYERLDQCRRKSDSLQAITRSYKKAVDSRDKQLTILRKIIQQQDTSASKKSQIILLHEKQITADNKSIGWLQLTRGISFGLLLVATGAYLSK